MLQRARATVFVQGTSSSAPHSAVARLDLDLGRGDMHIHDELGQEPVHSAFPLCLSCRVSWIQPLQSPYQSILCSACCLWRLMLEQEEDFSFSPASKHENLFRNPVFGHGNPFLSPPPSWLKLSGAERRRRRRPSLRAQRCLLYFCHVRAQNRVGKEREGSLPVCTLQEFFPNSLVCPEALQAGGVVDLEIWGGGWSLGRTGFAEGRKLSPSSKPAIFCR